MISRKREIIHRRFRQNIQILLRKFCREGSSPFSCRKYLRMVFSVFHKIYAHKWLYTAVCGHNIFFVSISWLPLLDLNQ